MKPLINIIIPTYNRELTIKRAIDSVLNQTYTNFKLIVIDDGSSDNTKQILDSYKNKIIYYYQENKGVSSARNKGIKLSKGEYIAFLDSDDEWKKNKLEKQIDFFNKNPEYKICQTNEIWIRNNLHLNQKKIHQKQQGWIFEPCLKLCLISPSNVIIHKDIFSHIGLFDETLPACEDYDLWLRITLHYPIGLLEEKLAIKYGGHSDQLSKTIWGLDRFRIKSMQKILKTENLTNKQKTELMKVLNKKIQIYENGCLKRKK
jgi:glycosyltransferase involved in cell wall biosynthesis